MIYFYNRDRFEPEPRGKVFKTMALGALAIFPAVALELAGQAVLLPDGPNASVVSLGVYAFVVVAFSEELVKLGAVWIYIYRDAEFDEPYDGVVYCVAASLGFAIVENVFYVADYGAGTGVLRALLAVPAHALFGVTMGYFVGQAKFAGSPGAEVRLNLTGLLAATLMHGTYDFLLFHGHPLLALAVFPLVAAFWGVGLWQVRRGVDMSPFKAGAPDAPPEAKVAAAPTVLFAFCPRCGQRRAETHRVCIQCGCGLSSG